MSDADLILQLKTELRRQYAIRDLDARVVQSPYRICPLGAHIDHQLGRVTAMTIDRAVHLAYVPQPEPRVRVRSLNFKGEVDVNLRSVPPKIAGDWGNYVRGAAVALSGSYE